jgi:hypothetical protein
MTQSNRPVHDADGEVARTYASALLHASGRVPEDAVDWDAFHTRLAARAELSLARLRYPRVAAHASVRHHPAPSRERPLSVPWWEHAARWSRLVITGSVAAGIALIMVVRTSPKDVSDTVVASSSDQTDGRRRAFESAAIGHDSTWSIESALLPSAADLLVPLGRGAASQ